MMELYDNLQNMNFAAFCVTSGILLNKDNENFSKPRNPIVRTEKLNMTIICYFHFYMNRELNCATFLIDASYSQQIARKISNSGLCSYIDPLENDTIEE